MFRALEAFAGVENFRFSLTSLRLLTATMTTIDAGIEGKNIKIFNISFPFAHSPTLRYIVSPEKKYFSFYYRNETRRRSEKFFEFISEWSNC